MKARIIDQPASVYEDPDGNARPIIELPIGTEVELGRIENRNGKPWLTVRLGRGVRGYLPGHTRIYPFQHVTLAETTAVVYAEPSAESDVVARWNWHTRFVITEEVRQDGERWARVRGPSVEKGFIGGKTRVMAALKAPKI